MESSGQNLIFLISQPRSGSTLTQRILGAHSQIYTKSEPWVMLHPAYSLKDTGIYAEYNFELERKGTQEFLAGLPNDGRKYYVEKLRQLYSSLYEGQLDAQNKKFYLDKTPRYYFITDELIEIFPEAKIILLIRNPLAVFSSIISTWVQSNWYKISAYKHDLIKAVDAITSLKENQNPNCFILQYEDLLTDPRGMAEEICDFIGVEFEEELMSYYQNREEPWAFGDQKNAFEQKGIDTAADKKWIKNLNNPQYWRLMYDYLHLLGKNTFEKLGYDYDECIRILDDNIPLDSVAEIHKETIPFDSLIDNTKDYLIENSKLRKLVQEQDYKIKWHNKDVGLKQKIIAEKEGQLKEKQRIIDEINAELNEFEQKLTEQNARLKEYEKFIEKFKLLDQSIVNLRKLGSVYKHPFKKMKAYKRFLNTHTQIKKT